MQEAQQAACYLLFALEAVLLDLASAAVDQIVCLGDVALFGPQPRETLERLRALNCPVIMGKTDTGRLPHSRIQYGMKIQRS